MTYPPDHSLPRERVGAELVHRDRRRQKSAARRNPGPGLARMLVIMDADRRTGTRAPRPMGPGAFWAHADLDRYHRGLVATDLVSDVHEGGSFTLLAPSNAALEQLRIPLGRLLTDPSLLEARFDLFEYSVVRGRYAAGGTPRVHRTLHGDDVVLGRSRVAGPYGFAHVLRTHVRGPLVVHVLDHVVYPTPPQDLVPGPLLRMVP